MDINFFFFFLVGGGGGMGFYDGFGRQIKNFFTFFLGIIVNCNRFVEQ